MAPLICSVSAPGKIILYGEHSVVYGKTAVALSLNLRTVLTLKSDADIRCITLNIPVIDQQKTWSLEDIANLGVCTQGDALKPAPISTDDQLKIMNFLKADKESTSIADRLSLALIFLYKNIFSEVRFKPGITIDITSSIPFSAGLGSSASIAVCLSSSLLKLAGSLSVEKDTREFNQGCLNRSDLELVNHWAFMIEKIFHGNPSGIDNTTSTYGGAVVYSNGRFSPMKIGSELKVLVVNSMIPRNTKEMVSRVRSRLDKYPAIVNPILESMDQISLLAIDLLQKSDLENEHHKVLEDLININQALLTALNVNHPKIQEITSIAAHHGFCAKLTGAGGGGVAFILLKPGLEMDQLEMLKGDLDKGGFQFWEVTVGGNGVEI